MIKVALKNPSTSDIINYRISEAQLDSEGNLVMDRGTGSYKETGVTLEWTLLAGETKIFPKYVADYLKGIYGFLVIEGEQNEPVTISTSEGTPNPSTSASQSVTEAKPSQGNVPCKYCGMNFRNVRALALHIASRHPEKII